MSPYVISGHVNYYRVVYCLLRKIYRQLFKKVTSRNKAWVSSSRPGWQGHGQSLQLYGQRQGRGLQGQQLTGSQYVKHTTAYYQDDSQVSRHHHKKMTLRPDMCYSPSRQNTSKWAENLYNFSAI